MNRQVGCVCNMLSKGKLQIIIRVGGLAMFLLFFCSSTSWAYDFVDRSRGVKIYYTVVSEENRTVEVARGDEWERYEGNYTIPRVVRHNGKRYRVVAIGKRAFAGCDELRNITFSSNITRIDSAAFSHCESLTRLNLPPQLKYLGDHAFAFCAFPYVKIPASVSHIGKGCFSYCQYVVDILIDEKNTTYSDGGGCSCIIDKTSDRLVQGCSGTIIPDMVRRIDDEAFAGCVNLQNLEIPESVIEIGADAFRSSGISGFHFPSGVTDVSDRLFYNCQSLKELHLPRTLLSIGSKVFYNCSALKKIVVESYDPLPIQDDAFPEEVFSSAQLLVPVTADDTYRALDGWKRFRNIVQQ